MSTERRTCYVVACDACRDGLEDPDEGYVPHFDTADAAIDYALDEGWHSTSTAALYCATLHRPSPSA